MKKITLVLLVLISIVILSTGLFAQNYTLTLQEARELAVKNNIEVEKAEVKLRLAEIAMQDADSAFLRASNAYSQTGGNSSLKEPFINAKKGLEAASNIVENAKITLEQLKERTVYEAEKLYLDILYAEEAIKIQEESYRQLSNNIKIERIKLDLGMSTKLSVSQQLQKLMDTENQLKTSLDNLRAARWQLNRMIGRDINSPLFLAPVAFQEVKIEDINEGLEKAKENSLSIKQLEQNNKTNDLISVFYLNEGTDKLEKIRTEMKQNELLKSDTEYALHTAVYALYDKQYLARKRLVDSKTNYETMLLNYTTKETQYKLGIISKQILDSEYLTLLQAKTNYEKAVSDYYLATREIYLAQKGVLIK